MGGVLGTGVAAGVAQTALQAQQLGRQRDKQVRETRRLAQQQLEVQRLRVEGLTEDDAAEDATRIRIDNQVPEHEHRELPEVRRRRREDEPASPADAVPGGDQPLVLGPPPLLVNTSGLAPGAVRSQPAKPNAAAAVYQHVTPAHKRPTRRLDVEG